MRFANATERRFAVVWPGGASLTAGDRITTEGQTAKRENKGKLKERNHLKIGVQLVIEEKVCCW